MTTLHMHQIDPNGQQRACIEPGCGQRAEWVTVIRSETNPDLTVTGCLEHYDDVIRSAGRIIGADQLRVIDVRGQVRIVEMWPNSPAD